MSIKRDTELLYERSRRINELEAELARWKNKAIAQAEAYSRLHEELARLREENDRLVVALLAALRHLQKHEGGIWSPELREQVRAAISEVEGEK